MPVSAFTSSDTSADAPSKKSFPLRPFTANGATYPEKPSWCVSMPEAIITSCGKDVCVGVIPEAINGHRVTGIADNAFRGCTSLTEITIPESVETIGSSAFAGCRNLSLAVINARTPPRLGLAAFPKSNLTIKVPKSDGHAILNAYRAAAGWKDFAERIVEQD